MTARFSRAAQQRVEFARKARGHRPRLQLTEYRLNWNSSTSGAHKAGKPAQFLKRNLSREPKLVQKGDVLPEAKTVNNLVLDARSGAWSRWKATDSLVRQSPRSGDFSYRPRPGAHPFHNGGVIV